MEKAIATNPNITDLFGVQDVLRAIDLERIQPMNLKAKVVVYIARPVCNQSFTAKFKGTLKAELLEKAGIWRKYGNYRLPHPEYTRHEGNEPEIIEDTPFEMLWSHAAYMEFVLTSETPEEFENFLAVPYFIGDMVDQGWSKPHPHHTSKMWLQFAKDDLDKEESIVLGVYGNGLEVYRTEVDGVQIFTSEEMERFTNLRKKKE